MDQTIFSRQFVKRLAYLAAMTVLFACMLSAVLVNAITLSGNGTDWVTPKAMAVQRVAGVTLGQSEPVFLNNLDCTPLTYRKAAASSMQTGCFTEAAFGLMDTDSGNVIFNGTDEGMPLLPYTPGQVLVPWPHALNLIGLDPVNDGGTRISLYNNVFTAMQDQHNLLGHVTAKRLDRPPDIILKDSLGKPLVINPQTIAFSEGGAWLVAETLGGAFIRVNLAALSMTAFAPAYGAQGGPALFKSRVTITADGRFIAIANDLAAAFKVYDLSTCDGTVNNLRPQNCRSYEYRPFVQQRINSLQAIRHLRFINDGLLSFDAITGNPDNTGTYELAPAGSITSLTDYIGLGDSYTSGEGAFDYLNGTDTPDNMCHVSGNSYPLLLARDLFTSAGGHSVACSGALIKDIGSMSGSYRGQVRKVPSFQRLEQSQPLLLESIQANFLAGYIAQQRFIARWQPRVATVSIGGNDIGFGNLLKTCVTPHISWHRDSNTCYGTYEDRLELSNLIDRTVPRWTTLYKQLQHAAPSMRLYAVGYPQIAVADGGCALNVQLNKNELELAITLTDYLNQSIRKAAAVAGIPYVDIGQALAGHRLCETAGYNVAVNGLTAGKDAGVLGIKVLGKESFHPNALGHELIEQAVLKQTRNLTMVKPDGTTVGSGDNSTLLDAPASGRTINTLIPDEGLTGEIAKRGAVITVQASGADNGLRPSATYAIRLDGPGGSVLGSLKTDANGDLRGEVAMPSNILPGGHTVDVTGQSQGGDMLDITRPIYVPVSETDMDGDNLNDTIDSCPGAINSGTDNDLDGIDDICDNLIRAKAAAIPDRTSGPFMGSTFRSIHPILYRTTTIPKTKSTPAKVLAAQKHLVHIRHRNPRLHTQHKDRPFVRKIYWLLPVVVFVSLLVWRGRKYIKKIGFRLQ